MRTGCRTALTVAGLLLLTTPALAKGEAAEAEAPEATQASFTDEQVDRFAAAAIEINRIRTDPAQSYEEKKPKIIAAIEQHGLDVDTFNSIGKAAKTDSVLKQKISAAISARSRS